MKVSHALQTAEIVTTQEMLGEFLTAFRHTPHLRSIAARRVHQITTDPEIRVLPQSDHSFQAGFALYKVRPDKEYSLTDCISMDAMRQEGITEILTHAAKRFVKPAEILYRERAKSAGFSAHSGQ